MTSVEVNINALRELCYHEPSAQTWRQICAVLDLWPEDQAQLALDYLKDHLAHWSEELLTPMAHWSYARMNGEDSPWWPLVRAWHVILTDGGVRRVSTLKAIRQVCPIDLKQAKAMLDEVPSLIAGFVGSERALEVTDWLERNGASVELLQDTAANREKYPSIFPPLYSPGFSDLARVMLHHDLTRHILTDAMLPWERLRCFNFTRLQLAHHDLTGRQLQQLVFKDSSLYQLTLTGADLRRANLRNTAWDNVYAQNVDLRGADLRGARLVSCSLTGADLRGAILHGAILGADGLATARLEGAQFDSSTQWPSDFIPPTSP